MWIRTTTGEMINLDNGNRVVFYEDKGGDFVMYRVLLFVPVRIGAMGEIEPNTFEELGIEFWDGKAVYGYELNNSPNYDTIYKYFNKLAKKLGAEEI